MVGHARGLLVRYAGDSIKDTVGTSPNFTVRGPFTLWAKVSSIDPTRVASASGISVFSKIKDTGDSVPTELGIDIGQKPIITSVRVTDLRCQFGCWISVDQPDNLRWDVRVLR
jgi:hypothetical protein